MGGAGGCAGGVAVLQKVLGLQGTVVLLAYPRLLPHILWVSLYETLNKVASYSVPLTDLLRTQLYYLCIKENIFWIVENVVDFYLD